MTPKQEWRRSRTPEQLAVLRASDRAYQAANKERTAAYRAATKAHKSEYDRSRLAENRAYRATDPWKKARETLNHSRQRARRYGIPVGTVAKETLARLLLLPCVYCGVMPANGIDHVVAMSRGGSNDLDNLASACWPCNDAKWRTSRE